LQAPFAAQHDVLLLPERRIERDTGFPDYQRQTSSVDHVRHGGTFDRFEVDGVLEP
jgi:hypothetical protein